MASLKDAPTEPQVLPLKVAEWWRGRDRRRTVRITLGEFQGVHVVDVRHWVVATDGRMVATKSGIALKLEHVRLLAKALAKTISAAERLGLLDAEPSPHAD